MEHKFSFIEWKNKKNVSFLLIYDVVKNCLLHVYGGTDTLFRQYAGIDELNKEIQYTIGLYEGKSLKLTRTSEGSYDSSEEEHIQKMFDEAEKLYKLKYEQEQKKKKPSKQEIENARKKYWANYEPLRQEWIKLIKQAQQAAFEKHGTRKLSVYIATNQNELVFYALVPGEKRGKLLYKCDGGSLMKEQVALLKIFCVDYLAVQTNWQEGLECTKARISTDFDVSI